MAVPKRSAAKVITFGGFKRCATSFCVAGVPFCDIATKPFCVKGAVLVRGFQKMTCIFCGRCSTLETSIVILRGRGSTLDVWCCVFFANLIVRAASSGLHTRLFALHTLHSTLYTVHLQIALYTLHSTLYT